MQRFENEVTRDFINCPVLTQWLPAAGGSAPHKAEHLKMKRLGAVGLLAVGWLILRKLYRRARDLRLTVIKDLDTLHRVSQQHRASPPALRSCQIKTMHTLHRNRMLHRSPSHQMQPSKWHSIWSSLSWSTKG